MSLFIAALTASLTYVNADQQHVFVGQSAGADVLILDLGEDNFENHIKINEDGEVFLKIDKIIAISKEQLSHCDHHDIVLEKAMRFL